MQKPVLPATIDRPPAPSRASLRGLDWFVFFVADVQTGFGPFISVYLTTEKWTQVDIGLVLTVGGLVALIGQSAGRRPRRCRALASAHVAMVVRW